MFDYVINNYNPSPRLITERSLDRDYLYVKYSVAPYMCLPKSLGDLKQQHKKKFWYNLSRSQRLYQESFGALHFEIVRDSDDLNYFLDQVYELFNRRWEGEYTSAAWKTKRGFDLYKDAMINLASKRKAFLAVLYDENRNLLSYGYCLDQQKSIFFYQHTTTVEPVYRKYSLGKILIHNILKFAVAERYERFDFMIGSASYKYEWAKDVEVIYEVIGRKTFLNYLKYGLKTFRYFLQFNTYTRKILKSVLHRVEQRVGRT